MRTLAACLVLLALAAGCGGSSKPLAARGARLPSLVQRCGSHLEAKVGWFRASDGVLLDGVLAGAGKTGVVLAHESPADLCGWTRYAAVLSRAGFRVLLFDHRGFGLSQSPANPSKENRFSADLEGAVDELKRDGADKVFLMGASFGGVTSMVAGSKLGSRIAGVVSVSGEARLGNRRELDALSAVRTLRVPLLILGSREDGFLPVGNANALLERAASPHKRLVLFPGSDHGWDLLSGSPSHDRASKAVIAFLRHYG